jgi:hypothetical protein
MKRCIEDAARTTAPRLVIPTTDSTVARAVREYGTLRRPTGRQSSIPEASSVFFTPYETSVCTSLKDRDDTDRRRAAQTESRRPANKQSFPHRRPRKEPAES